MAISEKNEARQGFRQLMRRDVPGGLESGLFPTTQQPRQVAGNVQPLSSSHRRYINHVNSRSDADVLPSFSLLWYSPRPLHPPQTQCERRIGQPLQRAQKGLSLALTKLVVELEVNGKTRTWKHWPTQRPESHFLN